MSVLVDQNIIWFNVTGAGISTEECNDTVGHTDGYIPGYVRLQWQVYTLPCKTALHLQKKRHISSTWSSNLLQEGIP